MVIRVSEHGKREKFSYNHVESISELYTDIEQIPISTRKEHIPISIWKVHLINAWRRILILTRKVKLMEKEKKYF